MRLDDARVQYLKSRNAKGKRLSPNTLKTYACDLQEAVDFFGSIGVHVVAQLEGEHVRAFEQHLRQRDKKDGVRSANTIFSRFRSLRLLIRWLQEKDLLGVDPFDGFSFPAPSKGGKLRKQAAIVTEDMVSAAATLDREYPKGYPRAWPPIVRARNAALLDVMRVTNASVMQVAAMTADDIDMAARAIVVGEYRYPLPKDTAKLVQRYLDASAEYRRGSTLWVSMVNTARCGEPLGERHVWTIIRETRDTLQTPVS